MSAYANGLDDETNQKRLRFFLFGVRLVGLLAALALTSLHSNPHVLDETLGSLGYAISGAVVMYYLISGLTLLILPSRSILVIVMLFDLVVGILGTYIYGEGYLFLVYTLPVLLCGEAFGITAASVLAVLGMLFYGIVFANPLLKQVGTPEMTVEMLVQKLSTFGVEAAASVLLLWLYAINLRQKSLAVGLAEEKRSTLKSLYDELAEKSEGFELVYREMTEQEARSKGLREEVAHLEHELSEAYKDLAKTRMHATTQQQEENQEQAKLRRDLESEKEKLISRGRRIQTDLEASRQALNGLQKILGAESLEESLLSLVYYLQAVLPSQTCVVFLREKVQGVSYLYPEVADTDDTDFFRELAIPSGEGPIGEVASEGQSMLLERGQSEQQAPLLEAENSCLVLPLISPEGETIGVCYLARHRAGSFTFEHTQRVQSFLGMAGLAVARILTERSRADGGLHDEVTGLHNGEYLNERVEEEVKRGRRYSYPVSLLLIGIDKFERLSGGLDPEQVGDILRQCSGVILEIVRDTDVAARISDHEFGVLLVHSNRDSAVPIGERIRSEIKNQQFGNSGLPLSLTASIGVVGVPHDASTAEWLRDAAERAINQAREQGGDSVCTKPF